MVTTTKDGLPNGLNMALRYGPQTQSAVRRSQYLADALKSIQASGESIKSPLELAARLGAVALLERGRKKADATALDALKSERASTAKGLLAGLKGLDSLETPEPEAAAPAPAAPPMQAAPPPEIVAPAPPQPVQAQPLQAPAYSPEDRDALTRMIATEAIGEGPTGMTAAGFVALNRLKSGHGGAKTLRDVVTAPHQFEGMSRAGQVKPEDYAAASQVADAILSGKVSDPTGGAVNFLNPELQAQMGRRQPSWAPQGQGQRIGRHVFYGGQGGAPIDPSMPPPPVPPQTLDQAGPITDQPFQVAANGPLQPGMVPASSPPAPPPAVGGAPGASVPQAAAPGVSYWRPTPRQVQLVEQLLTSNVPGEYEQGVALAQKIREKMAEPLEHEIQTINGLPYYVPKTPGMGGPQAIGVPQGAMTQVVPAQSFNPAAPAGAMAQRDPLGNVKDVPGNPPAGFEAAPGGGLTHQRGGPQDPTRPQAPASGYQYVDPARPGAQQAIPGSAADPRNPMNVIEGTQRFSGQIKTIVDSAMKVKQNYNAVLVGYRQQNGTGDIAIVNGVQRLIDDGVVKEGDVQMQMKANGLDGTVGGYIQYLKSGGVMTPEIRDRMYKTAAGLYGAIDQTYRVRVMSLKGPVDEAYGPGSFDKYVFPPAFAEELGWGAKPGGAAPPPPAPQPQRPAAVQATPGTRAAAMEEARKRGLIK